MSVQDYINPEKYTVGVRQMIVLSNITDNGYEYPDGYSLESYVGGVYVQYNYQNLTESGLELNTY